MKPFNSLILAIGVVLMSFPVALSQTISNEYVSITEYQGIDPNRLPEFDAYLERALIPALNEQGIESVGVLSRSKLQEDGTTSIFLLIPLANPSQLPSVIEKLTKDSTFLGNAEPYLKSDFKKPIYSRARSELLLSFDCFPKVSVPKQKLAGKDRLFELRVYESPNELLGHLKVEMFNSGELDIFRKCEIQPVFMGQALIGDNLPNLTYMTVYDNAAQRDECWKSFQANPEWQVMKADKKYEGTVSKIHKTDLLPRPYSQF
jgi:hypothetical protein